MAISTVKDLIASQQSHASKASNSFIGNLVFWQISETLINYVDYKDAAVRNNIPEKFLAPEKSDKLAFGQACKGAKVPVGYFWDNLKSDNKQILMYGLVSETSETGDQSTATNSYNHSYTLYLDRESKAIDVRIKKPNPDSADYDFASDLVSEVSSLFIEFQAHTKEEISKTCTAFMRDCGIFLTPTGKTYFVAAKHAELCDRFGNFISEVSPESSFIAIPQYESIQAAQGFGQAAKNQIDNELRAILSVEDEAKDIESAVSEWITDVLKNGTDNHAKTLNSAMENFELMRTRIDSFSGFLEASQTKLINSLDKASLCASAILDLKQGKSIDKYLNALGLGSTPDTTAPSDEPEEEETDF